MYIIGGVAVVVLGGLGYYCFCKDKSDDAEGGEDDRYSSLIWTTSASFEYQSNDKSLTKAYGL